MGSVPWWYPVVSAARYLGTDPWALMHQPVSWVHRAHAAAYAEDHAAEMKQKTSKR